MNETRESAPPLSDEELDAIASRLEAASAGPWGWTYDGSSDWSVGHADDPQGRQVACCYRHRAPNNPDAEFIAHARSDVPRLLAELRRLRAEHERLKAGIAEAARVAHRLESELTVVRGMVIDGLKRDG